MHHGIAKGYEHTKIWRWKQYLENKTVIKKKIIENYKIVRRISVTVWQTYHWNIVICKADCRKVSHNFEI